MCLYYNDMNGTNTEQGTKIKSTISKSLSNKSPMALHSTKDLFPIAGVATFYCNLPLFIKLK